MLLPQTCVTQRCAKVPSAVCRLLQAPAGTQGIAEQTTGDKVRPGLVCHLLAYNTCSLPNFAFCKGPSHSDASTY